MSRKKQKHKSHSTKHSSKGSHTLKGILEITRSGIGYAVIGDGKDDVLIRPNNFNNALNGDEVIVKVVKENAASARREGRVVEVKSRKQTEFVTHYRFLQTSHSLFLIQISQCPTSSCRWKN
jgi:ribonuclease R